MRAPLVVLLEELAQARLGVRAVVEVLDLPELALERADGALDLPAATGAIGLSDDVVDERDLEEATEVGLP